MPLLQVIVLAIVQGLTEFLPISSTAHLYLTSRLFGWQLEGLDFDIALHIGTLLAVLLYFARDWAQIIAQGFGVRMKGDDELQHNHMLLWLLVIGSIPVGLAGLLFNKQVETTWRNPFVIGGMLIAVGVLCTWRRRPGAGSATSRPSICPMRSPSARHKPWPSCPEHRAAASPS